MAGEAAAQRRQRGGSVWDRQPWWIISRHLEQIGKGRAASTAHRPRNSFGTPHSGTAASQSTSNDHFRLGCSKRFRCKAAQRKAGYPPQVGPGVPGVRRQRVPKRSQRRRWAFFQAACQFTASRIAHFRYWVSLAASRIG